MPTIVIDTGIPASAEEDEKTEDTEKGDPVADVLSAAGTVVKTVAKKVLQTAWDVVKPSESADEQPEEE